MKKRILSVVLAAMMAMATLTACGSGSGKSAEVSAEAKAEAQAQLDALGLKKDFDPNTEYADYTLVDYEIADIGAQFVATVSRSSDGKKYEIHCNFYGDEQLSVYDNGKVTEDKTGSMETDTPIIVEKAEKQGTWVPTK
jgi:hypothetical protein